MHLSPRHVSLLCLLLLACGDSTPEDGARDDANAGAGNEADAGSLGGLPTRDGGAEAARDGGAASQPRLDAGRDDPDARDSGSDTGGGPGTRDPATPTQPADAAVAGNNSLAQHCVDEINRYRATLSLAPLARAADKEACTDAEAEADSKSGKAHGAFGMCKESAQNECPGWPSKDLKGSLDGCLKQMWAEGPGDFNDGHGHYINMSSTKYKRVACGMHDIGNGKFWAIQNFF